MWDITRICTFWLGLSRLFFIFDAYWVFINYFFSLFLGGMFFVLITKDAPPSPSSSSPLCVRQGHAPYRWQNILKSQLYNDCTQYLTPRADLCEFKFSDRIREGCSMWLAHILQRELYSDCRQCIQPRADLCEFKFSNWILEVMLHKAAKNSSKSSLQWMYAISSAASWLVRIQILRLNSLGHAPWGWQEFSNVISTVILLSLSSSEMADIISQNSRGHAPCG